MNTIPAETVIVRDGVSIDVTVMVEHSKTGGTFEPFDFDVSPVTVSGEYLANDERAFVAKSLADCMNDRPASEVDYQSALADEAADSEWDS